MSTYNRIMFSDKEVIDYYTVKHLTMQEIADKCGVTRQAVKRRLDKLGIHASMGTRVQLYCRFCNRKYTLHRKRWRNSISRYCSKQCYYNQLAKSNYVPSRKGSREAREIVNKYFPLDPKNIVHHKDNNQTNNALSNLAAFKDQSDHIGFHRNNPNCFYVWNGLEEIGGYSPFIWE